MRKTLWLGVVIMFCGCSTYQGVGSEYWHVNRLEEIETAYKEGKLTESEYLKLKNESDYIRQEYLLDGIYRRDDLRRSVRPYRYR